MLEHVVGADARVDPKILRQVAEPAAQCLGVGDDVDIAEGDCAAAGGLQRGDRAHEGGFAGAIGAEQAEHALRDQEGYIIEGTGAVGIDVGDIGELEHV